MYSRLKLYITLRSSDIKTTIKCIEAEIVLISLNSCLAIMVACKGGEAVCTCCLCRWFRAHPHTCLLQTKFGAGLRDAGLRLHRSIKCDLAAAASAGIDPHLGLEVTSTAPATPTASVTAASTTTTCDI